jgi:hypothetical protein
MAMMSEPDLGERRALARYGWYRGGTWRGFMMGYASLRIARIAPPEHRLVCLS